MGTAARDLEWIRRAAPAHTEAQPYRVRVWHDDDDGWCACVGMALCSGMDLDSVCADLRREVERGEHIWSARGRARREQLERRRRLDRGPRGGALVTQSLNAPLPSLDDERLVADVLSARILCPACGDLGKRDVVHDHFCVDCVSYAEDQHTADPSPESQERDEDGEIQCYVEALEDILHGWVPGKAPESRSALGLGKGAAR